MRLFAGAGVFGDSLRALRHGMLGQLAGKNQSDRGLDFSGGDSRFLVVGGELGCLSCDALEDVCVKIVRLTCLDMI
jgi:hypothetical protein